MSSSRTRRNTAEPLRARSRSVTGKSSVETDSEAMEQLRRSANAVLDELEQRLRDVQRREREIKEVKAAFEQEKDAIQLSLAAQKAELDNAREIVDAENKSLCLEKERMALPSAVPSDILTLNIGGEKIVQRRRSTLCAVEGSFLSSRFSGRWEHDLDRDESGRYFINYPPELFMPVLNYLSVKETEGTSSRAPLPQGPEGSRPHFEAMMRFFDILRPVKCELCAGPYEMIGTSAYGLAFEVQVKEHPIELHALQAYAHASPGSLATVYVSEGYLNDVLHQRAAWTEVGRSALSSARSSRIQFKNPVPVKKHRTLCIYIATNLSGGIGYSIAPGNEREAFAENLDMKIFTGLYNTSPVHFHFFNEPNEWRRFVGKLEYTVTI
eukprot:TRINITY_DN55581_c0_g1_i1.p1 TRINITY_DN55581_c0_g1~~TRINITY_DN55581_c0_g1_i1.p1  ORF type:complete len:417 (-),score=58.62 TRINITY_DN55581_c0_g1_i1:43-1188(-)